MGLKEGYTKKDVQAEALREKYHARTLEEILNDPTLAQQIIENSDQTRGPKLIRKGDLVIISSTNAGWNDLRKIMGLEDGALGDDEANFDLHFDPKTNRVEFGLHLDDFGRSLELNRAKSKEELLKLAGKTYDIFHDRLSQSQSKWTLTEL